MRVCVRVDDLGWLPETVGNGPEKQPDRGLALAQRFHAAMQGRPYLGAVIPASLDEDGKWWLQSQPVGLTVAQHGTTHAMSADRVADEYHDLRTLAEFRCWIEDGLRMLGLGSLLHFVPPFNAVGALLPEALYLEGFRWIWGAPSTWATPPQPYGMGRMNFVPSWRPLYGATRWRMQAEDVPLLEMWPQVQDLPGRAVLTLHLPWESAHDREEFIGVRRLIDVLGDRIISPAEFVADEQRVS